MSNHTICKRSAYLALLLPWLASAQVPVNELPSGTTPSGPDYTICDQAGVTSKCTDAQFAAYISTALQNVPLSAIANQAPGTVSGVPAQASSGTAPTALSRPTLYAKDFGAKCDNSTDDTTALNAFFAYMQANRFTAGEMPPGVCRFATAPLSFPTNYNSLKGAGRYSTVLFYTGASTTTDLVHIFGASLAAIATANTYSGFSVQSATVMTAGAGLNIKWVADVSVDDYATGAFYDATNNLFNGTVVQSSGEISLTNFESSKNLHDGFQVFGGGIGAPPQYDLKLNHFEIQGNAGSGIHVGGGWDGVNIDDGTAVGNRTNVVVDHALSSFGNQELLFGPQFYTNAPTGNASNVGDNYLINDSLATAAQLCNITIGGPVTLSAHENGINIESWPACPVNVNSTAVTNNAGSGIYIQDSTAIITVSGNTGISLNARYGIESSSATSNVKSLGVVSGNTLGKYLNVSPIWNKDGFQLDGAGDATANQINTPILNSGGSSLIFEQGGTPIQSMTVVGGGHVNTAPLVSIGSQFTAVSSCGGTITVTPGTFGPAGGYFAVPTGGANCQFSITVGGLSPVFAPHAWYCSGEDFTSQVNAVQANQSTTGCVLQVTAATGDLIQWGVVTGY